MTSNPSLHMCMCSYQQSTSQTLGRSFSEIPHTSSTLKLLTSRPGHCCEQALDLTEEVTMHQ